MRHSLSTRIPALALVAVIGSSLGGCHLFGQRDMTTGSISPNAKLVKAPTAQDKDCLQRAMYFESIKSDEDGLLAVGSVVMNRLDNPKYPDSICGVVGAPRQFAAGVLSRPVRDQDRERLERVSDRLLAGERHHKVGQALHFHTAGLTFPYDNMRYVALAGGNTFYIKTERGGAIPAKAPESVVRIGSSLTTVRYASLQTGLVRTAALGPVKPQSPLALPFFTQTAYTSFTAR